MRIKEAISDRKNLRNDKIPNATQECPDRKKDQDCEGGDG